MNKINFKISYIVIVIILVCINTNSLYSQNTSKTQKDEYHPKYNIELKNRLDSVSYCLGSFNAVQLQKQGLKKINADAVALGLKHGFNNDIPMIDQFIAQKILQEYFDMLHLKMQEAQKIQDIKDSIIAKQREKDLQIWLQEGEEESQPVEQTNSGLKYEILRYGDGKIHPTIESQVTVHYHGSLLDGTMFDNSISRGEPLTFPVNGVIKGWVEALQLMKKGDKWKITVPYKLAYGEEGRPPIIPPKSDLIFIVELLEIK